MRFPGFIGPSYTLQSVNADCQRSVNLYPELNEIGTGKEHEIATLNGTPGLRLLATVGNGPIRGAYTTSTGRLYVVSGNVLYSVDKSWTALAVSGGTLSTSYGPVSMADNGLQMVIVDGSNGYYVDFSTDACTKITSVNFYGANTVAFQDGYFIFNKPNTDQFYISGLNAITFDPTEIATAEGSPDYIVGLISDSRNLYLFGSQSLEIFYDSGAVFPFERIQGAFIPIGCMATFSIARLDGAVYWLGQSEQGRCVVYRAQGLQSQRISTHAIEKVLSSVGSDDLSSARAWTYQQRGHSFYCLNFPGADTTWVYDTETSLWHERASLNHGELSRHRADCHAFAYGTNVVGDYVNGNIYALDPDTFSENGASIPRLRAAPHISKDMNRIFHSYFQLDMETGVGLDGITQGSDPIVTLEWSDDSGHSWSNEHQASIGKIGQTKMRAIWRRLGMARDRVYRVKISDPVKVIMLGVDLGIEEGAS